MCIHGVTEGKKQEARTKSPAKEKPKKRPPKKDASKEKNTWYVFLTKKYHPKKGVSTEENDALHRVCVCVCEEKKIPAKKRVSALRKMMRFSRSG